MTSTTRPIRRFSRVALVMYAAFVGFGFVPGPHPLTSAVAQDYREGDRDGDAFDRLEEYGDWVNHWRYGRVWYPRDVDEEWRPYTRGRWELTDEYGWYWESREPWGWATYHYGRWALDDDYGWIWIPGDTWGPAWVDWRQSDDQIGWAPLPPEVGWGGGGLAFGEVDLVSEHYRPAWCFVPLAHFHDRDVHRYIAPPSRNVSIIHNTTRITNYTVVNNTVINRSVDPRRIERFTHRDVRPVQVNLTPQLQAVPRGNPTVGPRGINVFRPDVRLSARPTSPLAPVLPQGGFRGNRAPAQGPVPEAAPQRQAAPRPAPQAPSAPQGQPPIAPQRQLGGDGDRLRTLERHQAEEANRLQALQARERANSDAARNAEIGRRHQAEQSEMQRIQQSQRAAAQNRAQMPAPQPPPQRAPQPQPPPQAKPQPQQQAKPQPPNQPGQPPPHQ